MPHVAKQGMAQQGSLRQSFANSFEGLYTYMVYTMRTFGYLSISNFEHVFIHILDVVIFMHIVDAVIFIHILDAVIFMHISDALEAYAMCTTFIYIYIYI